MLLLATKTFWKMQKTFTNQMMTIDLCVIYKEFISTSIRISFCNINLFHYYFYNYIIAQWAKTIKTGIIRLSVHVVKRSSMIIMVYTCTCKTVSKWASNMVKYTKLLGSKRIKWLLIISNLLRISYFWLLCLLKIYLNLIQQWDEIPLCLFLKSIFSYLPLLHKAHSLL